METWHTIGVNMYQYKGDKKNEIMFHVKGSAKEPYEVIC